ncbi:hypothetical protein GQ54DRAFT_258337 [Martensiomyces pterosporus]|nr:hypothetical protein GQ54DRAFT_258337 [Martensiomyces pterosporus]
MITSLPAIRLDFTLPSAYPLSDPPQIALSCCWLRKSALDAVVHAKLDEVWETERGMSVLDMIVNIVRYDLEPTDGLQIELQQPGAMDVIAEHSKQKERDEFESHTYPCLICMEEQSGKHCIKLNCSHIHCRRCLTGYLGMLVEEGSLLSLKCPHPDCRKPSSRSQITVEELESLLDSAHMERYRRLSEKRRVETDGANYSWCPREGCGRAAQRDKTVEKLCMCECGFAFCLFCRRAWHGTNYCAIENRAAIVEKYKTAKENGRRMAVLQMEKQYGASVLNRMLKEYEMELESIEYIRGSTQQCPTCRLPIAKSYGCNHMRCTQCDTHFCYLCGAYIDKSDPLLHFNTRGAGCHMRLFEGIEQEDDEEETADGVRDAAQADEYEANLLIQLALGDGGE